LPNDWRQSHSHTFSDALARRDCKTDDLEARWRSVGAAQTLLGSRRFCLPQEAGQARLSAGLLERDPDGLVALKYPHDRSAILSSIVQSDGLVVLDECQSDFAAGSIVDF
jgi:molybdopterin biosynthesis enzyme